MSPSISERGTSAATEFDHHDVHAARAHQGLHDLECLFAGVGLGDKQVINVHTAPGGIGRVERMFHVNVRRGAAHLLQLSHDVLAERGLARRLGTVDLGDAAARHASHAERDVERERTGRDGFGCHGMSFSEAHDRAVAITFEDVAYGFIEDGFLAFVHDRTGRDRLFFLGCFTGHGYSPLGGLIKLVSGASIAHLFESSRSFGVGRRGCGRYKIQGGGGWHGESLKPLPALKVK